MYTTIAWKEYDITQIYERYNRFLEGINENFDLQRIISLKNNGVSDLLCDVALSIVFFLDLNEFKNHFKSEDRSYTVATFVFFEMIEFILSTKSLLEKQLVIPCYALIRALEERALTLRVMFERKEEVIERIKLYEGFGAFTAYNNSLKTINKLKNTERGVLTEQEIANWISTREYFNAKMHQHFESIKKDYCTIKNDKIVKIHDRRYKIYPESIGKLLERFDKYNNGIHTVSDAFGAFSRAIHGNLANHDKLTLFHERLWWEAINLNELRKNISLQQSIVIDLVNTIFEQISNCYEDDIMIEFLWLFWHLFVYPYVEH